MSTLKIYQILSNEGIFMLEGSSKPMKKVTITVSGRVQGVGFRYHTKLIADQIGVTGTVENMMDGSVFIKVSAPSEKLDTFIEALKNNKPSFSRVDSVDITEKSDLPEFSSFKVIH